MGEAEKPRFIPWTPPIESSRLFGAGSAMNIEADAETHFKQVIGSAKKDIDAALLSLKKEPSTKNAKKVEQALENMSKQLTAFKTGMSQIKNLDNFMEKLSKIET